MSGARSLRSEAALTAGGALVATGLGGVTSIAIARALGVEQRGVWAVVASTALLAATLAAVGLPEAAAYGVARAQGSMRHRLVLGSLVAGLGLGAAAAIGAAVALLLQDETAAAALAAAGAAVALVAVLQGLVYRLVQAGAGAGPYALVQVAAPLLLLVAVVPLALADALTPARVGALSAAAAGIGVVVGLLTLRRAGTLPAATGAVRAVAALGPLVGFGLITFGTLAVTHVVQRVDVLLVNGFLGATDAGLYAVAVQFADLLLVVPAALGLVAFRRGAAGEAGHWQDFGRTVRFTAVTGIAAAAALMLVAPWALRVVFGAAYVDADGALRLLAPGAAILGVQSVVSHYVASRGRPAAVLVAWSLAAVAALAGDLVAIPRWGIEGAAAVSTLAYALVLALHVEAVRRVRAADREAAGPDGGHDTVPDA